MENVEVFQFGEFCKAVEIEIIKNTDWVLYLLLILMSSFRKLWGFIE